MLCISALIKQSSCLSVQARSILKLCEKLHRQGQFRNEIVLLRISRTCQRFYSSSGEKDKKELAKSNSSPGEVSTTFQTVKETTKTASYTGVILIGIGVTSLLFYAIFRELFSGKSPNNVYSKTLDRCLKDYRIVDSLGEPIKGFGEETRRGRRRHVSHLLYEKEGVNYLRMKFYIQGSRRRATVHLEMKENDKKEYEYRYLFVQLDDFPNTTFVLEDNRLDPSPNYFPQWS